MTLCDLTKAESFALTVARECAVARHMEPHGLSGPHVASAMVALDRLSAALGCQIASLRPAHDRNPMKTANDAVYSAMRACRNAGLEDAAMRLAIIAALVDEATDAAAPTIGGVK